MQNARNKKLKDEAESRKGINQLPNDQTDFQIHSADSEFVLKPFKTKLARGMTIRKLEEMMREI